MLPILSTAAATGKVAGRGAARLATDTARSAFVDPFKSAIAQSGLGQAADVIKEIRSEAAAMRGDKAADKAEIAISIFFLIKNPFLFIRSNTCAIIMI